MKIDKIYKLYYIPPNLQEHMLRVAGLSRIISDNWKNHGLDSDSLILAALFHDIGNIIKFDLDKGANLLGEEGKNVDYWKEIQREFIYKYGKDEHQARDILCKEIGLPKRIIEIISKKSPHDEKIRTILKEDDYELKILSYADTRIGPFGLLTLKERLNEIKKRVGKIEDTLKLDLKLEEQIQARTKINLHQISCKRVESYFQELRDTII